MSNLLDQAIIDAEALKEVAMRNAEAAILDKFSGQIKEAVEQILDEEPEEEIGAPTPGLEVDAEEITSKLAPASAEGVDMCACPDVEDTTVLNFNLQDLEADLDMDSAGPPAGLMEDDLPLEEEFEIDESSLQEFVFESAEPTTELSLEEDLLEELMGMLEEDNMGMSPDAEAQEAAQRASEAGGETAGLESTTQAGVQRQDESVNTTEEVVEEALTVDIDPLKTEKAGWMNTPQGTYQLAEEELLAMLEDSEQREKFDEMQKAVKSLQESNDKLQNTNNRLNSDKGDLIKIVGKIKNQLNESNLANAKLLYTNKVLMSDSMNERQKNKIAEALSNSESVEEAKVIYETLQSATGSTIKNKKPESLSEATNKTTSTLILSHRRRDREKTTQDDSSVNRWKVLAGLNNK
jgi:hypothetical protein